MAPTSKSDPRIEQARNTRNRFLSRFRWYQIYKDYYPYRVAFWKAFKYLWSNSNLKEGK